MAECPSCRAWFVWPPPQTADLVAHYDQNVAGMPGDLRRWRSDTVQDEWYGVLARRIRTAAHKRGLDDPAAVVDVGAGGLELTARLAQAFPRAGVEAWDMFADGADRSVPPDLAGRVSTRHIDLNQIDEPEAANDSFDIVVCIAVIEHVLDPAALLRLIRSISAPRGFAYVVGPEVTSIAHRILQHRWPYYCPDEHLTLPSLRSIEAALEPLGGSYELRRVNVHYSLRYLMRFLRIPVPVPAPIDFLLPIPSGAFELIWAPTSR